jgi:hypothetical protein
MLHLPLCRAVLLREVEIASCVPLWMALRPHELADKVKLKGISFL